MSIGDEWQVASSRRRKATVLTAALPAAPPDAPPRDAPCCLACSTPLGAADECARCGYWEAPVLRGLKHASALAAAPAASASATRSALLPLAQLQPTAAAPAFDLGDMPPLSASWPAALGAQKGAFAAACVACSPRRRCAAHKRSAALPTAPQRARAADAALTAAAAEQLASRCAQQAYCVPELDEGARARVLAAATGADTAAPSVAEMRNRMGGDKRAAAPLLCTAWGADANEPRSRVRAMLAAGWRPVPGTLAGHPRWERTLQAGPFVGLRQVLNFSSTYSTFCWDNQTADLVRADRQARGER